VVGGASPGQTNRLRRVGLAGPDATSCSCAASASDEVLGPTSDLTASSWPSLQGPLTKPPLVDATMSTACGRQHADASMVGTDNVARRALQAGASEVCVVWHTEAASHLALNLFATLRASGFWSIRAAGSRP
jgi:hypothetical protein